MWRFFNITGRKVLEASSLSNHQLNVSALQTGVYLIRITDNSNSSATKKLVIK